MAFAMDDGLIERYRNDGYVVLRGILPPSLVTDLRRYADRASALARQLHGPQTQRLQPLFDHPELDLRPVVDYVELPALRDAVARLLSPRHEHATREALGLLIEPTQIAWATLWHRDWRDNTPLDRAKWTAVRDDIDLFNQANCALYDDSCTWVVPGSQRREDLPGEQPYAAPEPTGDAVVDELAIRRHCEGMPGAVRLDLGPGDYAVYRNAMWHLGAYVPYRRRATLHDFIDTPRYRGWRGWAGEEFRRHAEAQVVASAG